MTGSNALQTVWEAARPSLAAIQSSINPSKPLDSRVLRVGQLDAELLDQELAQVLQEPITKALSLLSVRSPDYLLASSSNLFLRIL